MKKTVKFSKTRFEGNTKDLLPITVKEKNGKEFIVAFYPEQGPYKEKFENLIKDNESVFTL